MYVIFEMVSFVSPQFVCVMLGLLPCFLLQWLIVRRVSKQTSQLHQKWWFIDSPWTCCKTAALRGATRPLWEFVSWPAHQILEAAGCRTYIPKVLPRLVLLINPGLVAEQCNIVQYVTTHMFCQYMHMQYTTVCACIDRTEMVVFVETI